MEVTRKFTGGWTKDAVDDRDYKFAPKAIKLPTSVDLRKNCPAVMDQGDLGSCTAFATSAMVQLTRKVKAQPMWLPSALFTYYSTRLLEGTVNEDSGATLRNTIKSTVKYGVTPELYWRYVPSKFAQRPIQIAFTQALKCQTIQYQSVNNSLVTNLQSCLAEGYSMVFGMYVYNSFMSNTVAKTGMVPLPNFRRERPIGGHAMMIVGYEGTGADMKFLVMNSWGNKWGINGYCKIPASYLTTTSQAADFWTIRLMES